MIKYFRLLKGSLKPLKNKIFIMRHRSLQGECVENRVYKFHPCCLLLFNGFVPTQSCYLSFKKNLKKLACVHPPPNLKNIGEYNDLPGCLKFENVITTKTTYKNLHDFLLNNCVWTYFNRYNNNKTAVN